MNSIVQTNQAVLNALGIKDTSGVTRVELTVQPHSLPLIAVTRLGLPGPVLQEVQASFRLVVEAQDPQPAPDTTVEPLNLDALERWANWRVSARVAELAAQATEWNLRASLRQRDQVALSCAAREESAKAVMGRLKRAAMLCRWGVIEV